MENCSSEQKVTSIVLNGIEFCITFECGHYCMWLRKPGSPSIEEMQYLVGKKLGCLVCNISIILDTDTEE